MKKKIQILEKTITNKMYWIRNQKVMIDRDLAQLYGVETKVLKQAVKRNMERFPNDFMFELNKEEFTNWRSQFVTSNSSDKMGLRYVPFVFTEQGVAMLSSVLNSKKAIEINIKIIRVFIKIRQTFLEHVDLKLEIENIKQTLSNQSKNIELVFTYLDELIDKTAQQKPRKKLVTKNNQYGSYLNNIRNHKLIIQNKQCYCKNI